MKFFFQKGHQLSARIKEKRPSRRLFHCRTNRFGNLSTRQKKFKIFKFLEIGKFSKKLGNFKESMELGGNASMDSNQGQKVEKGRGPQI